MPKSYNELRKFSRKRIQLAVIRAAKKNGSRADVKLLKKQGCLDCVCAEAWEQFIAHENSRGGIGDGKIMDQILRFLQFVLDNWDIIGPIFTTVRNAWA